MATAPIDRIITDIRHLAEGIGVRPPLSNAEYETAQFVKNRLEAAGIDTEEQSFHSLGRLGWRLAPAGLLTGVGIALGLHKSRWVRYLGMMIAAFGAWTGKRVQTGQPAFWELILPQSRAHNIIGRIPPCGDVRSRVVLVANLDTHRERRFAQFALNPCTQLQRLAFGSSMLTSNQTWGWIRKLLAGVLLGSAALVLADEKETAVPGANNNASGVALLLNLAAHLHQNPLEHTEVVLAFTGCDTVGGRGSAELARHYRKTWKDAQWLAVRGVGAGELCWVIETSPSRPDGITVETLRQITASHPAWGILGRPLAVPDPAHPFTAHDLDAVAVMGYERTGAAPVNWQQSQDTPDTIQPDSLSKAWHALENFLLTTDRETQSA